MVGSARAQSSCSVVCTACPLMLMLDAETQAYDPRAREAQGRSGVQGQSGLYEILLKKEKRDYF